MTKIAILSFTDRGRQLAESMKGKLDYEFSEAGEGQSQRQYLVANFDQRDAFIFIGATGIAVRFIAPLLKSKDVDPAVIVIDELGRYVISLVSGHLGGANELAVEIADKIGGTPIITTATDINEKFAVDLWTKKNGVIIADISKIKKVSGALLRGEEVGFTSAFTAVGEMPEGLKICDFEPLADAPTVGICVDLNAENKPFDDTLNVLPKCVTIGVGCRKGIDSAEFEKFIMDSLTEANIDIRTVANIGSINLKIKEKCINDFSAKYNIPFNTATTEELKEVKGDFSESKFVQSITGVDNVCERAAVLFSDMGRLIRSKKSRNGITIAIAVKDWKCKF